MRISHQIFLTSIAVFASGATIGAQGIQVQIQSSAVQIRPKIQTDLPLLPADALEKLKLTNEQNTKYGKLETEYKEKAKSAQDKYQNDIKGLRDREQFKDAQDKLKTDTNKARADGLGKLEPILTDEQKATLKQVQTQEAKAQPNPGGLVRPQPIGPGIGQVLPPATQNRLQLTDEQKKQIADIQKEVEAKVMKVLTDEQKKTLEQMKKGPSIRPLPVQPNPRIQIQPAGPNVLPANPKKD